MHSHDNAQTATAPRRQIALILGITGSIGGAIAAALSRRGFQIRALSRNPDRAARRPFSVDWMTGDALVRSDVVSAARGADIIVHTVNPPGYRRWREAAIPMLANSIEAAATHGATILFPANVYVYSANSGEVVDEETPRGPQTRKGRVRLEMETMLADAARERGVRTIAVRAGDFFGPGVNGSWFAQAVAKGGMNAKQLQDPCSRGVGHAWAYVPDLAETFAQLVDMRERLGAFEMLHFGGHWIPSGRLFCEAARQAIGRPDLPIKPFPWFTVYLGAPFSPFLRELIEMLWLWRHSLRLDNRRLESLIGQEPHTPLPKALREVLGAPPPADAGATSTRPSISASIPTAA
jgi:nucleoside-diphosphate-sugar epimerase